ncbi:MAG: LptF/LptG family permease [Nitrospinae bacterium]|nr:LptF/LptG family permease [Nitrospinota bacterium]
MKIIQRYILLEVAKVLVLSLFILMSILVLEKINFISNMTRGSALAAGELFGLILYTSPAFLVVSIPLASMLASLSAFSRLSADNEITAMRASGASFARLMAPVALISAVFMAASLWLSLDLLHKGNYLFDSKVAGYVSRRITTALGERVFFDKFPNVVMYVSEKPAGTKILKGVFVFDSTGDQRPRLITARKGYLDTMANDNVVLKLEDGAIYSGDKYSYREITFGAYEVTMDVGLAQRKVFEKGSREMSPSEMLRVIGERAEKNQPANGEWVELSKRFSLPIACLVLGVLGAPLGAAVHRGGRWGGVGTGIILIIANYVLLMVGEGLGMQGTLNPVLAVFLPDLVMGALAVYLLYRESGR